MAVLNVVVRICSAKETRNDVQRYEVASFETTVSTFLVPVDSLMTQCMHAYGD